MHETFAFECGCTYHTGVENRSYLACCKLHELPGQTLAQILQRCPMLLVRHQKGLPPLDELPKVKRSPLDPEGR